MTIHDYGNVPKTENLPGIPARVTAVHKERYEIVCDYGMTHARLKTKEYFVDTPSMRELGMWEVSEGLSDAFTNVEAFLGRCRFSDCRHKTEPGCAIRAAIASGELDIARWESYQKLKEEAVSKDEMLRRKNEWAKGVAKFSRQRKKEIW